MFRYGLEVDVRWCFIVQYQVIPDIQVKKLRWDLLAQIGRDKCQKHRPASNTPTYVHQQK